jgi:hypothetical protein
MLAAFAAAVALPPIVASGGALAAEKKTEKTKSKLHKKKTPAGKPM